jgi:predicted nucleic acid-binding Zn ribbon protein
VKRRQSELEPLGQLVPRVLRDLGFDAAVGVMRVAACWEEAVGAEVALHCRPTSLRGGTLEASVDSSVWCQQLQLQAPRILAGLRRALGDDAPTAVRFRVG